MSNQNIDLSIIILNYKMDGLIRNCLKSIFQHDLGISHEIIVVDNDSGDSIEHILQTEYPQCQFIQAGSNTGWSRGNNIGLERAKGKYILVVNPDIVFLENVFEKWIQFMNDRPEIGMSGPQLTNPDKSIQQGAWRFYKLFTPVYQRVGLFSKFSFAQKHLEHFHMKNWDRSDTREVDWVQGSCLMVRRETINHIGPIDEDLFLYFTDVEWCRRAWDKGWKVVYYSDIPVIHYFHRESANKSLLKSLTDKVTRIHIKDWFTYLKKYWRDLEGKNIAR